MSNIELPERVNKLPNDLVSAADLEDLFDALFNLTTDNEDISKKRILKETCTRCSSKKSVRDGYFHKYNKQLYLLVKRLDKARNLTYEGVARLTYDLLNKNIMRGGNKFRRLALIRSTIIVNLWYRVIVGSSFER